MLIFLPMTTQNFKQLILVLHGVSFGMECIEPFLMGGGRWLSKLAQLNMKYSQRSGYINYTNMTLQLNYQMLFWNTMESDYSEKRALTTCARTYFLVKMNELSVLTFA